jgi:hypothetical protein
MTNPNPTREALTSLLSRVEGCTGADPDVDHLLHDLWPDGDGAPNYSASLDAALALVERVRPGWDVVIGTSDYPSGQPWARIYPQGHMHKGSGDVEAKTPALALLAALLKSLIGEGE